MKFTVDVKAEVLDAIQGGLFDHKLDQLSITCLEIDKRATKMVVTQLVSDMVCNGYIEPVVLNPITGHYEVMGSRDRDILRDTKTDDEFRKLYRSLKKRCAREIRLKDEARATVNAMRAEEATNRARPNIPIRTTPTTHSSDLKQKRSGNWFTRLFKGR